MKDNTIPDSNITASSALLDPNDNTYVYHAYLGRLDGEAFWNPSDNPSSWVQVDFGYPNVRDINGIITQGSAWWNRWVETLQVKYGHNETLMVTILEDGFPKVQLKSGILLYKTNKCAKPKHRKQNRQKSHKKGSLGKKWHIKSGSFNGRWKYDWVSHFWKKL